ncbi:MAG: Na+/H+ antiporter NhaA [Bacteroidota bacterium]|nr:Na+/H+ antiporter NhaA [Bacteroidota bacterium]
MANETRLYKIFSPIRDFINDSRSTGILLIACTLTSILLSNLSATSEWYIGFWQTAIHIGESSHLHLPENYLLVINDVLMTLFFFLVGMEIKRELTIGELASIRKSLLPVMAALGGMICPAVIYSFYNFHTPGRSGWGIPMATDIAFSLGVLSLLGKKIPIQLKIFLAALAIIDDLGAVITIAVFYTAKLNLIYLLYGLLATCVLVLLNKFKVEKLVFYLIPAAILWYCIFNSGVHATVAGVITAFCMPLKNLAKLEHVLHKPVNFIIMPLFALANTAILLPNSLSEVFTSTISPGVMLGLIIGKPLGIFFFSFISIKLGFASLPSNTHFKQLWGIGLLGGIGFTMSIFTSTLAFQHEGSQIISKVSVMVGSLVAGIIGYLYLYQYKNVRDIKLEHPPRKAKTFTFTPGIRTAGA